METRAENGLDLTELKELKTWLIAAAQHKYGCAADEGRVWLLPDTFAMVFGVAYDPDSKTLNLYCQLSEMQWLQPAMECTFNHESAELNFWYLNKVAFVLPLPTHDIIETVALYNYPDLLADPLKTFQVQQPHNGTSCCSWPEPIPRFHFGDRFEKELQNNNG